MKKKLVLLLAFSSASILFVPGVDAAQDCPVSHEKLTQAVKSAVEKQNGGFGNQEWAVAVDREGKICAVTFSGTGPQSQWLGSRAIAAEKAYTVNAFSTSSFALSTANLYASVQPGGYLYGTAETSPPDPSVLYAGKVSEFGTKSDPWIGKTLGGGVAYGGGLALYHDKRLVGGLGVSGDTSCADHNVAWRIRESLGMGNVPDGPGPAHNDQAIYDIGPDGKSASGFGQPICHRQGAEVAQAIGSGINVSHQ
ncbi:MAG: heme-binding protein [Rhodomicrobium sp.]